MAGSLLGPDQVKKVNAAFPQLVAHLRSLLAADHTGVGLMRVHMAVESFDSDEMARIFRELSFISPKEKLALVRAAVYEIMATQPALFVAPEFYGVGPAEEAIADVKAAVEERAKRFTPPQYKLNVNKSEAFTGQRPADTPAPAPVVTSTHTPKVAEALRAGEAAKAEQQAKIDAAVAKLREASAPKAAEVVSEDAGVQAEIDAALGDTPKE